MKKFILSLFGVIPALGYAQLETTLPSITRLHQASYYNPAILPAYSGSLTVPMLPGISFGFGMEGIKGATVFKNTDPDGFIDLPAVHKDMKGDRLGLNVNTNIELFHLRFRSKKWYYGINLNTRTMTSLSIAKDFLALAIHGNAYFAGKTADFSSTSVNVTAFNELGFSMARNANRWNFGARAKFLHGVGAVNTSNAGIKLYTPTQTTAETSLGLKGTINTAGIPLLADSINGRKTTHEERNFRQDDVYNMKNLGAGIDLGVTYDVSNYLSIGAAITDLGFIRWKQNPYNYTQNDVTINYGGLPYENLDSDSLASAYGDSLVKLLEGSISQNSFTTMLPARFLLSGTYRLNKRNSVGAVVQGSYYAGRLLGAYTVNYVRSIRSFDFTANYSIIGHNFANVGLGLVAKAGAMQFYLVQDNVLGYFMPQQAQWMSVRLGINFVWGEIKHPLKVY